MLVFLFGMGGCGKGQESQNASVRESGTEQMPETAKLAGTEQKPESKSERTSETEQISEPEQPVPIYGISFTNGVYSNPSVAPVFHHTEDSYRELSEMGINTVRFYLNYGLFEEDEKPYSYKESGFAWIEKNIAWAEKYNIQLILNMHYPQGGYQSGGSGAALWTEKENQDRFTALWEELAKRYANEPVILGYGLLNEPIVPAKESWEETRGQWEELAQRAADAVRKHDKRHYIFVERLQGVTGMEEAGWSYDYRDPENFIGLADEKYVWEFHYYNPLELTHQGIGWYGSRDGCFYPGARSGRSSDPVWIYSEPLTENPAILSPAADERVNLVNLTADKPIEKLRVTEYGADGSLLRTYFDGMDFAGDYEAAGQGWNFQAESGHRYQVSWQGDSPLRADYFDGQYGGTWDRETLREELEYYCAIGREKGIPMYLGETGVSAYSLGNGLGGDEWLRDVLEIAAENRLWVTVHCYHEADGFGLYGNGPKELPTERNEIMYSILNRKR